MVESPQKQTDSKGNEGEPQDDIAPVIWPEPNAVEQFAPAKRDSQEPKKKRRWANDPAMFWLNLLGLIVVSVYTFLTYRLVRETQRTVRESHIAAEISQSTAKRQLRAYVVLNPDGISDDFEPTMHARAIIANVGQTPATDITAVGAAFLVRFPLPDEQLPASFGKAHTNYGSLIGTSETTLFLGPNSHHTISILLPRDPTPEEGKLLKAGKASYMVIAAIYYTDTYGERHFTRECYSYTGPKKISILRWCNQHNDAD